MTATCLTIYPWALSNVRSFIYTAIERASLPFLCESRDDHIPQFVTPDIGKSYSNLPTASLPVAFCNFILVISCAFCFWRYWYILTQ